MKRNGKYGRARARRKRKGKIRKRKGKTMNKWQDIEEMTRTWRERART